MRSNKTIALILIALSIVMAVISQDITQIAISVLIGLIAFRSSYARFAAVIIYVLIVVVGFLTGRESIIGVLFWFYITMLMFNHYNTGKEKVSMISLDHYQTSYYANLFIGLVFINLIFVVIMQGFSLASILNIQVLFSVLASSLQFLGVYLIAMRICEGALFYIGYIVIKIILYIFIFASIGMLVGVFSIATLILQAFVLMLFYLDNK